MILATLYTVKSRSSHRRCPVRKGILRNSAKFTGKHLCQGPFFDKVAPQPATLLKERPWHMFFHVNFVKFLRTPSLQNTSERLLLQIHVTLCSTYLLNDVPMDYALFVSFISVDLLILNSRGIKYKVGNFNLL